MCLPAKVLEAEEKVVGERNYVFYRNLSRETCTKQKLKSNDEVTVKPEISRKNNEMKVKAN